MDYLNQMLVAPSLEVLPILKAAVFLILLIHLPFMAYLLGGSFLSVVLDTFGVVDKKIHLRGFAREIIKYAASNKGAVFGLGILPLVVLVVIYSQILFQLKIAFGEFLFMEIAMVFAGVIFLYFYKNTFTVGYGSLWLHTISGWIGVLLLTLGCYHYFAMSALLLYPEKWPFITNPLWMSFASNALLRYGEFFFMSIALASVGSVYFFYHWPENNVEYGEAFKAYIVKLSGTIGLIAILIAPIFTLLDAIRVPSFAKDEMGMMHYGISIAIIMLLGWAIIGMLWEGTPKKSSWAFFLFLIFFANVAAIDYHTREEATKGYTSLFVTKALEQAALETEDVGPVFEEPSGNEQRASDSTDTPAESSTAAASNAHTDLGDKTNEAKITADSSQEQASEIADKGEVTQETAPVGPSPEAVKLGEKLYKVKGCNACHSIDGNRIVGPSFKGIYGKDKVVTTGGEDRTIRVDAAYIKHSIQQPNDDVVKGYPPVMVAYQFKDNELDALVAYIQSLQ
jgi:cytochrome c2